MNTDQLGDHALDHLKSDPKLAKWLKGQNVANLIAKGSGVHTVHVGYEFGLLNHVVPCTDRSKVIWLRRGERENVSPHIVASPVPTDLVTYIVSNDQILTLWAGPVAPKEPNDPSLVLGEFVESDKFWRNHAFCLDKAPATEQSSTHERKHECTNDRFGYGNNDLSSRPSIVWEVLGMKEFIKETIVY